MLLHLLLRPLPLALPIATGWLLGRNLDRWQALGGCAVIAAVLAAVGLLVLRSVRVQELSWRNALAGVLLPWGYRFGGQLGAIVGTSWLVWSLLAGATVLCTAAVDGSPAATATATAAATSASPVVGGLSFLLLLGWIVNGGLLLYTLGHRSRSRSLQQLQLLVVAVLVASVALHCTGHSELATLLAGGPPLVLGLAYGGYLGLMVLWLFSKNKRWN